MSGTGITAESGSGAVSSGAKVAYELQPVHQLQAGAPGQFTWQASGDDPHFLLKGREGTSLGLAPGWYRVDVRLRLDRRKQVARFYFDAGEGFREADSVELIVQSDEPAQFWVYLPEGADRIRFDPQERAGQFSVDVLSVSPLARAEAVRSCLEMLAGRNTEGAGTADELKSLLEARAQQSGESFDQTLFAAVKASKDPLAGNLSYEDWIEDVERPSLPDAAEVIQRIESLPATPVVSVLVPVFNPPERLLRRCLDSVLDQSYPHWELCIVDDASTAEHVRSVLRSYIDRDPRIRVVYRQQNGHISEATNSALAIATGEYIALLDHDDELAEHALLFMVEAFAGNADALLAYSDEDKILDDNTRYDPHFKSDWNPDLLFSQNYVSHLGVYSRELVNRIGGFRKGYEGSQDHDLVLRCLPHLSAHQIVHVPRVLYHWRAVEGSTARSAAEKDYTSGAGLKAVRDFFEVNGPAGVTVSEGLAPNSYRVKWPIPDPAPLVSLLIPTRDRKDLLDVAVTSILQKTRYPNYEILILDNGSVEAETLAFFEQIQRQDSRVRVLEYDHPFNFSAINNFGVEHARGSVVGLINNDVEVINDDWLDEMVGHACRPDIGCVGARLYYSNDTLQHAGVILGLGGVAGHSHKHFHRDHPGYFHRLQLVQNLSAVTAACLLVRKDVYTAVGGLDGSNLQVAFNDVDFCLRVQETGLRNLWTPYAELYHHESVSRGQEDSPEKIRRFQGEIRYMQERWGKLLRSDPYYNPNLTLDREDFSISV